MKAKLSYNSIWLLVSLCISLSQLHAQRDAYWHFGDSAGIHFVNGFADADTNGVMNTQEASAAISDEQGNLLFYTDAYQVWNRFHEPMPNGIGLAGGNSCSSCGSNSNTNGVIIIPFPNDTNKYFIYYIAWIFPVKGLNYSVVDMRLDSGRGDVILPINRLAHEFNYEEKITATKHANGKDWWLVTKRRTQSIFYSYLLKSDSIIDILADTIGFTTAGTSPNYIQGEMEFDLSGSRLVRVTGKTLPYISESDFLRFDRCTGSFHNPEQINLGLRTSRLYGACFSPNGNIVYIASGDSIFQFDLSANPIEASKYCVWTNPDYGNVWLGQMLLGQGNRVFVTTVNIVQSQPILQNQYLSVVNSPDSIGTASDFQPHSLWLGGRLSRTGLPNMPNYALGPLTTKAQPGDTCTWTGEYDDDWFTVCNWSGQALPDTANLVIIPGGTPVNPVIRFDTGYCKQLHIAHNNGAHLNIEWSGGGYLVKKAQ